MGGADRFFVDDVVLIGADIFKDGFEEKPEFVAWERVRKNPGLIGRLASRCGSAAIPLKRRSRCRRHHFQVAGSA
jgi:hypothetical protein